MDFFPPPQYNSAVINKTDVIVIGGGAAGLMCAIEAGRRGRSVTVLDHAAEIGRKIAISGGGRCNFTNIHAAPENYFSEQREFCKSALARYTPQDFIGLIEKHRVSYHEKKLGQLFCDDSAMRIVDLLLEECRAAQVQIRLNCAVQSVRKTVDFQIETSRGDFSCDALVIATGGLSFPKLGATSLGHRLAKQFNLRLTEIRPGLVPLTLSRENLEHYGPLSGVSIPSMVQHHGHRFSENILFTHRGLSGPAILQISSCMGSGDNSVDIDLLPGKDAGAWLLEHHTEPIDFTSLLSRCLPRRFAEAWCRMNTPATTVNRCKSGKLREIGMMLNHWKLPIHGTEGYAKAEVTMGGVDTRELSSKTMEARSVPGLYFIGEVVDVTGWLGGFNFQWAWASGHAAGRVV
jgi:predicted Rossmann fold flavoprotein